HDVAAAPDRRPPAARRADAHRRAAASLADPAAVKRPDLQSTSCGCDPYVCSRSLLLEPGAALLHLPRSWQDPPARAFGGEKACGSSPGDCKNAKCSALHLGLGHMQWVDGLLGAMFSALNFR